MWKYFTQLSVLRLVITILIFSSDLSPFCPSYNLSITNYSSQLWYKALHQTIRLRGKQLFSLLCDRYTLIVNHILMFPYRISMQHVSLKKTWFLFLYIFDLNGKNYKKNPTTWCETITFRLGSSLWVECLSCMLKVLNSNLRLTIKEKTLML